MQPVTREIMWSIPGSIQILMYILFVVAMVLFIKGYWDKYQFVTQGKGFKSLMPHGLNWQTFFKTIMLQDKVARSRFVAVFHSMIYYGFIILWIATDLVAIHHDTPFKVFQGKTYIIVSFLADWAGMMMVVGICLAYYRRYIVKPDYLSSTKPKSELKMYAMLLALIFLGYLLEGLRLVGTGFPEHEKMISPIGWSLALALKQFNFSDQGLITFYQSTWVVHMINTMLFIVSCSYTKFSHIILAPLAALFSKKYQAAVLKPMNFEDESAETFGLGKFSELTAKNRFDTLTCVECGRCTNACPANRADKPLNPKTIITKLRDHIEEEVFNNKKDDFDIWESTLYTDNELDACTTCGACMEECPLNIEHVPLIMDLKRYKALTLGQIPPSAADAVNKIRVNGNPWGISQDDRDKWAEGLDVPRIEAGKKVDYLYYVGCAGSYDASNQKVVQDTVMLLKKAGVDFAIIGKTEKCNGDPVRRFGDEYSFFEMAIENIANLNQYQFDKIVTHCPHCLHTIGKEYAKFEDGDFKTIHHTELLNELVQSGKLKPSKSVDEEMTFHDPCYLGRHHGQYNAPRSILNAIPGVSLKEMEQNKDKALCCGMGGGNMWYEIEGGKELADNRLEHVGEKQVGKLATACSYCMINFNSSKGKVKATEELEIEDIAQILARSVD